MPRSWAANKEDMSSKLGDTCIVRIGQNMLVYVAESIICVDLKHEDDDATPPIMSRRGEIADLALIFCVPQQLTPRSDLSEKRGLLPQKAENTISPFASRRVR